MSTDTDTDTDTAGPVPLTPRRRDCGRLAIVVSNLGLPYVGRLVPDGRGLGWYGEWGVFRGKLLRADKDDEGRWLAEGDPLELGDGREVAIVDGKPVQRLTAAASDGSAP